MTAVPEQFDKIREDIKTYEREALEISSPRSSGKGASSGLSKDQMAQLVGLLWRLSSAYKDYTKLLEQSLVEIRRNMEVGEEKRTLEDTAVSLDRLIDSLQKIEDITDEFKDDP